MAFDSFIFPFFALLSVFALRLSRPGLVKDAVIFVINSAFIFSFCATVAEIIPLLVFIGSGYVGILAVSRFGKRAIVWLAIFLMLLLFIWLKQYAVVSFIAKPNFIYLTVGLSYILFRILHLVVDVSQGVIKAPSLLRYFNYTTFFLSFVSGPIQNYSDYQEQVSAPSTPLTDETLRSGIFRTSRGYFLLFAVVTSLGKISTHFQIAYYMDHDAHEFVMTSAMHAVAAGFFMVYLYLNFVAYMDIIIGIGKLAGITLPENFNHPFTAENFLDLWNRWHITLSQWFKTYLFYPFLTFLAKRWGDGPISINYLGAMAFFVTFLVMGLWHGATGIFLLYGLALGLGATVNKLWQVALVNHYGRNRYRLLCRESWYIHSSRSAALAFFALSLTCLWVDPSRTELLAEPFTWACILAAFAILTLVGAFAGVAGQYLDLGQRVSAGLANASVRLQRYIGWPVQSTILTCLIVILALVTSGSVPEIVYKGF